MIRQPACAFHLLIHGDISQRSYFNREDLESTAIIFGVSEVFEVQFYRGLMSPCIATKEKGQRSHRLPFFDNESASRGYATSYYP